MNATSTVESIEPFFFGPPARRLYGCYHEPPAWPAREVGIVLCYPYGQEYIRSHRAFHHLAARLARAGFPTLRFDYYGSGDSAGDADEIDLAQGQADLSRAVDELRTRSGVGPVLLAGLRMGATLALTAAPRLSEIAGLVLWEPVIHGDHYLDELRAQQDEAIWRYAAKPRDFVNGTRPAELLGFALSEPMRAEIECIDLMQTPTLRSRPILLVESQGAPEMATLAGRLQEGGARLHHAVVPSFTVWVEDVDKGLVPQQIIEAIALWLEESFV